MPVERGPDRGSSCAETAELLPVYLSRSLEEEAARRVEDHLTSCAACRQEERDARTAWALFEGHLPVELLVDYALDQPLSARRRAVVESHLSACERCSGEAATVREEHGMSEVLSRELHPPQPPSRSRLSALAWAASIAALVTATGWFWTWRQLADARAPSPPPTVRPNLSVVELLPATQPPLRQGHSDPQPATNLVELPEDAGELVLVLLSGGRRCGTGCFVELHEAGRTPPARRTEGLVADRDGHLTLGIPGRWLPPGRSVITVRQAASGETVAEYPIEIRDLPLP